MTAYVASPEPDWPAIFISAALIAALLWVVFG